MRIIIIILSFLLYQTSTYSKVSEKNEFNQKYLSNYFSALVSSVNQKNDDAIKFFNSSKFLIKKFDEEYDKIVAGDLTSELKELKYIVEKRF